MRLPTSFYNKETNQDSFLTLLGDILKVVKQHCDLQLQHFVNSQTYTSIKCLNRIQTFVPIVALRPNSCLCQEMFIDCTIYIPKHCI